MENNNDFQRGDIVEHQKYGKGLLVQTTVDNRVLVYFDKPVAGDNKFFPYEFDSWVDAIQLTRFPRAGETIRVSMNGLMWEEVTFIKFDGVSIVAIQKINDNIEMTLWNYWKFIEPKKDDIDEIIEAIRSKDESILKEIAEVILERRNNDR